MIHWRRTIWFSVAFIVFHVPEAIVRYNQYMGGVDLWDMVWTG
jgi:hypothetical protein